ncbi:MAG TPA: dynamin family protein [Thermomicrobiales bacterium]|nr:dynamin family protein [Thermomicrobiales bacterium]
MVRDLFRLRRRDRPSSGDDGAILTQNQHDLLQQELALLERLAAILESYPATPEDRDAIHEAAEQLTSLFLLVIVGEFNSGKSAFINALVGADVMPEGVTPTTAVINLLRYGETLGETMLPGGVIERTFPAPFLDEITVVDTPGTNAIIREHEALTQRFVPRSDLVLFITSADRPFTESERGFMEDIREWGKKVVVIINKIDLVRDETDVAKIITFVRENIARLLGFTPELFPISALLAQQAKALGERNPTERERLWKLSRFDALETYIFKTLDEEGRIRLKLLSPLGTAEHISDRYLKATTDRLAVLEEDVKTIQNIERQLTLYQEDMRRQFAYHLTRIENIIARMNARGDEFFEETIRLGRIFDLLNSDKIRGQFERAVVGDTEQEIDATIDELIDWMVEQDLRTWEAVNEYIDRRRLSKYEDEMIGEVGGQFRYDRRALLESVSKVAQEEVDRYDPDRHAHELSVSVRSAVAQVAVAEAGAVGLGALVVAAASTVAVDVTGILAASLVAGLGLFILPRKRRQSRAEFRRRSEELEQRLIAVMSEQFDHELARSVRRIEDAIAPYTRFVRDQRAKLTQIDTDLTALRNDLRSLRHRVGDPETAPPVALPSGTHIPAFSPADETPQPLPAGRSEESPGTSPVVPFGNSTRGSGRQTGR